MSNQETLFGEQENEFEKREREKELKKQKQFEVENLHIDKESCYATVINFEGDKEPFEFLTFKRVLGLKKVFNKKTKKTKFIVMENLHYKDLEEMIYGFENDLDFGDKETALEFLYGELEQMNLLARENKKSIFWDCRRYMWKYKDKELTKAIPRVVDIPNNIETKIRELSIELKRLLKDKHKCNVSIQVIKLKNQE